MSIYRNGPHTVTVFLEEGGVDSRGNFVRRPSTTGVVVAGCLVHPVASTRGVFPAADVRVGQQVDAAWKLVCDDLVPLGWWSRVEWRADGGAPADLLRLTVLSGPLLRRVTRTTSHITCTLQEER